MKIAFDEHFPPYIVKIFKTLSTDGGVIQADFVSAKDYVVKIREGDIPWITRFAADGGSAIITGDCNIRKRLHEQRAVINAGLTAFFFAKTWSQKPMMVKAAMVLNWWPEIERKVGAISIHGMWEIPCQWHWTEMRSVTPPKRGTGGHE